MKISILFSFGIGCVVSGVSIVVYAITDYQNRVYEYRYLPSQCVAGSSCPFPAVNDTLLWIGVTTIVAGIVLILFRKIKSVKNKK